MKAVKEKSKLGLKEKIIITILSVVIAISLLCVAAVFILNSRFLAEGKAGGDLDAPNGAIDDEIVTPPEIKGKTTNFLICGIDYQRDSERGKLTDVIMVASFDIEAKNVDILQIPRDTYIGEDYPTGKINAIYGQKNGGIDGLSRRISKTLKIPIDHYVTINMDSFINVVDEIGGVEVNVPKRIDLEGVTIEAGLQTLDGKQAEIFVRERKSYANGDLGRMEMQKLFLKSLVNKMFSLGTTKMISLATTLINEITTDLTLAQMLGYYQDFIKVDKDSGINFHVLPTTSAKNKDLFVFSIMKYPAADMLNTFFRPYTEDVSADELYVFELETNYEYTPPENGIYKEE